MRGKGTHKNQAPQWDHLFATSTSLILGHAESECQNIYDISGNAAVACCVCGRNEIWPLNTFFYIFSASNHVRKPSQNSAYTRNEIWPWNRDFKGQGCLREFFYYFFTYSVHQTTYKNLLKTWLILKIKFDLELAIFKVKGVCGNFLTIFFIFSAWNYIEIPSQTSMTNETNFLHCTLRCLRGWSIYRPAVRSGIVPEICSDFMYKFCIF